MVLKTGASEIRTVTEVSSSHADTQTGDDSGCAVVGLMSMTTLEANVNLRGVARERVRSAKNANPASPGIDSKRDRVASSGDTVKCR